MWSTPPVLELQGHFSPLALLSLRRNKSLSMVKLMFCSSRLSGLSLRTLRGYLALLECLGRVFMPPKIFSWAPRLVKAHLPRRPFSLRAMSALEAMEAFGDLRFRILDARFQLSHGAPGALGCHYEDPTCSRLNARVHGAVNPYLRWARAFRNRIKKGSLGLAVTRTGGWAFEPRQEPGF